MTHEDFYTVFGNNENDRILRKYLVSKRMEGYIEYAKADIETVKRFENLRPTLNDVISNYVKNRF